MSSFAFEWDNTSVGNESCKRRRLCERMYVFMYMGPGPLLKLEMQRTVERRERDDRDARGAATESGTNRGSGGVR